LARFHLDHDVSRYIAPPLRFSGHSVVTAHELGLDSAPDGQQLLSARAAQRILVSHNRKDFQLLHDTWYRWAEAWGVHRDHEGILILPQTRDISILVEALNGFAELGFVTTGRLYRWRHGQWTAFER